MSYDVYIAHEYCTPLHKLLLSSLAYLLSLLLDCRILSS